MSTDTSATSAPEEMAIDGFDPVDSSEQATQQSTSNSNTATSAPTAELNARARVLLAKNMAAS